MMLADAAQASEGKLYVLGGGWSITGPGPVPSAIALKLDIPWDQANMKKRFRLQLFNQDGQPLELDTPAGLQPVKLEGELEVGRPPGVIQGSPLDAVLAVNVPPLPLEPGQRYSWVLFINDDTQEDWRLSFTTRSLPPGIVLQQ
jgi:hypothetical protein